MVFTVSQLWPSAAHLRFIAEHFSLSLFGGLASQIALAFVLSLFGCYPLGLFSALSAGIAHSLCKHWGLAVFKIVAVVTVVSPLAQLVSLYVVQNGPTFQSNIVLIPAVAALSGFLLSAFLEFKLSKVHPANAHASNG